MNDVKPALASKGIWAALLIIIASLATAVSSFLSGDYTIMQLGMELLSGILAIFAIFGRVTATKQIEGIFSTDK